MISMRSSTSVDRALLQSRRAMKTHLSNLEHLSTGRRINRARDDAAGMALSTRVSTDLRSRAMATRNAQDALSALQIGEDGLGVLQVALIRIRELAVMAASGTVDDSRRSYAQQEVARLLEAIDQTAKSATYSGLRLLAMPHLDVGFILDGSSSMRDEIDQVINSIDDFTSTFNDAGIDVAFGLADMNSSRDGEDSVVLRNDINEEGFDRALQAMSLIGGAVDPYSALLNACGIDDHNNDGDDFTWNAQVDRCIILITDTRQEVQLAPGNPTQEEVAQALEQAGIRVFIICDDAHNSTYDVIAGRTRGGLFDKGDGTGDGIPAALNSIANRVAGGAPEPIEPVQCQVGIHDRTFDQLLVGAPFDATPVGLGVSTVDISTQDGALAAIDEVDKALELVVRYRSHYGAMANQIESAISSNTTNVVNESATNSRIEDLDVAKSTAELTRDEVIAQTSHAVLAQAGRLHADAVLKLLGLG